MNPDDCPINAGRVIIAGSLELEDVQLVAEAVRESGLAIATVIHDGSRGIAYASTLWAAQNQISHEGHAPQWLKYGVVNKKAGPERHRLMARIAEAIIVIPGPEYPDCPTHYLVKESIKAGLQPFIFTAHLTPVGV